mgnify:CR=1 FL=1
MYNSPLTDVNVIELALKHSYKEGVPEAINHKTQELLKTRLETQKFKSADDPLFKLLYIDTYMNLLKKEDSI